MLDPLIFRGFSEELQSIQKTGAIGEVLRQAAPKFLSAAKQEAGPAAGAVIGAGLANMVDVSPLAGAAAGYGLGAIPEIIHGVKHRGTGES